jgi:hypothetical protein
MASIETLIAQIDDLALRDKLGREVAEMKKRLDWGLLGGPRVERRCHRGGRRGRLRGSAPFVARPLV